MPPSGTLTVVVTLVKANVGNCTVVPSTVRVWPCVTLLSGSEGSCTTVPLSVVTLPSNVNVSTSPIWLKNGTSVRRTNRRSAETTACTFRAVPSLSTTITGW